MVGLVGLGFVLSGDIEDRDAVGSLLQIPGTLGSVRLTRCAIDSTPIDLGSIRRGRNAPHCCEATALHGTRVN
jgi:hypothetical protein